MTSSENTRHRWIALVCLLLIVFFISWMAKRFPVRRPQALVQKTPPPAAPPPPIVPASPETPKIKIPVSLPKKPPLIKKQLPLTIKSPVATAPATAPPPVFVPPPPPPEPREWQGNDTSVTHVGQIVIRNDRQWIHFWSEHHPHEAAPDIDFARDMVIGVFAGPRPADPFSIRIVGVRALPAALVIDYRETLPPTGTFAVNVTVYPYDLKVIPQSGLSVKFNLLSPDNVTR